MSSESQNYDIYIKDKLHICSCPISTTQKLMCRHIFAVKASIDEKMFDPSFIPERWHKRYQHKEMALPKTLKVKTTLSINNIRPLTKKEKFKKLTTVLNSLADLCSEVGTNEFDARFEQLSHLHKVWSNKEECVIVPVEKKMNENSSGDRATDVISLSEEEEALDLCNMMYDGNAKNLKNLGKKRLSGENHTEVKTPTQPTEVLDFVDEALADFKAEEFGKKQII